MPLSKLFLVLGGLIFSSWLWSNCDKSPAPEDLLPDTTVMTPPPPPMTLFDTLVGTYTDTCFSYSRYFNSSTGQWIIERDTAIGSTLTIAFNPDSTGIIVDGCGANGIEILFSAYSPGAVLYGNGLYEQCAIYPAQQRITTIYHRFQGQGEFKVWGDYDYD